MNAAGFGRIKRADYTLRHTATVRPSRDQPGRLQVLRVLVQVPFASCLAL